MNKHKRKFDGVGEQGSLGGHWDRGGLHGHQNLETQNGARFCGGDGGGRDGNNGGGGGVRGGNSSNTNPFTKTDRKLGAADRTVTKEVGWRRRNNGLGGWGNIREVSHRRPQEKVRSAISAHMP